MVVRSMIGRGGKAVANQFIVEGAAGSLGFQSYETLIGAIDGEGRRYLNREGWDCSKTTARWRNVFFGEDVREGVRRGEYEMCSEGELESVLHGCRVDRE